MRLQEAGQICSRRDGGAQFIEHASLFKWGAIFDLRAVGAGRNREGKRASDLLDSGFYAIAPSSSAGDAHGGKSNGIADAVCVGCGCAICL